MEENDNNLNDNNFIEEQVLEHKSKKTTKKHWQILTVILGILFIASILTAGFHFGGVSKDTVKSTLEELSGASVLSVEEENGLYKANIKDEQGKEGLLYMTKDGKMLFQGAIDVEKLKEYIASMKGITGSATQEVKEIPKTDKPKISLFYMAYCPYGVSAMLAMKPVVELLKDKIDFEPHYVIYGSSQYQGQEDKYCINGLCSMHGISELNEDIRQACVFKHQKDNFWNYIECAMKECKVTDIDTCWKTCAQKKGIDIKAIEDCQAKEGLEIIKAENALNTEKGVQGSPTTFINNVEYSGARDSETLKQSVCTAFTTKPADCETKLETTGTAIQGNC